MPQCNTPPRPEGVLPFDMRRREFITLLGGVALAWPLAARAEQADRIRRVGVLMGYAEADPQAKALLAEFTQAVSEFGWIEGRNLRMDVRWAPGNTDLMRCLLYTSPSPRD